jgi:3-methyladenine DNA glycosylase AlkD
MDAADLIRNLESLSSRTEAERMAQYHKIDRVYLGVRVPLIAELARAYWKNTEGEELIECCGQLWETDIHEARTLVGKLFEVRKLGETEEVWRFINRVKEDLNSWAIADHLESGARQSLQADTHRMDQIESEWLPHSNFWVRRASLVYTLFLAKKGADPERPLRWAEEMVDECEWFIQKAIAWWLRELSKHNPQRVQSFLGSHGSRMKAFARKEASKYL